MTNQELETIYKNSCESSHADALRTIYNLGHMTGAGIDPAVAPKDAAAIIAAPSVNQVNSTKKAIRR